MTNGPIPCAAVIIGTRPEALKLAPVVAALRDQGIYSPWIVSTGQHREMLNQALAIFDLRPDLDLRIMKKDQTPASATALVMQGLDCAFRERRPSWVIVQGDTSTALGGALTGFDHRIPVAHVEAGLRSHRPDSPFPEEMNRRLVDQIATLLFAPTTAAAHRLLKEGFARDRVVTTGNTIIDALLAAREKARRLTPEFLPCSPHDLLARRVILVTAHRRESFGEGLESICRALRHLADSEPDIMIVYPVHLNPQVAETVRPLLKDHPRICLTDPLDYLQMLWILERAFFVMTDSGGIQEEAPSLGKPVLVLRDVTERPEGVAAGVARIVGTQESRICEEARRLLHEHDHYGRMAQSVSPYGNGNAARLIVDALHAHAAGTASPEIVSADSLPFSKPGPAY